MAKISVIVPTYNMGVFCPEAINSIFENNFDDFELIIVDDGSIDDTEKLLKTFIENRQSLNKQKIVYINQPRKGTPAALNRALQEINGEFVTILDADDKLTPLSLKIRYEKGLETNAEVIIGSFLTFNKSHILGHRRAPETNNKKRLINQLLFSIKSPFHLNSILISRDLIKRVGKFDESLLRGLDKDFAIRLIMQARGIETIDKPVYMYRRYKSDYIKRLKTRITTLGDKIITIKKHTSGIKRIAALLWGAIVEFGKMVYELFTIYKK